MSTFIARKIVPVSASATPFPDGPCFGLQVGVAGTVDGIDADGTARTGVPVFAGFNRLSFKSITVITTATGVFALY